MPPLPFGSVLAVHLAKYVIELLATRAGTPEDKAGVILARSAQCGSQQQAAEEADARRSTVQGSALFFSQRDACVRCNRTETGRKHDAELPSCFPSLERRSSENSHVGCAYVQSKLMNRRASVSSTDLSKEKAKEGSGDACTKLAELAGLSREHFAVWSV